MDLNKSSEFFDPKDTHISGVTIVGCGAVGSQLCILLARLGIDHFELWDDDTVDTHNIANQAFRDKDITKKKVDALAEIIAEINPFVDIIRHDARCEGVKDIKYKDNIFMCVDSVVPRQKIAKELMTYSAWTLFDFRMGLTSGQSYIVTKDNLVNYLSTLNFTDEEADKYTPKSACNYTLSVDYSIWVLLGLGLAQIVQYWKGEEYKYGLVNDVTTDIILTL